MDYGRVICEKFPIYDVEILNTNVFELEDLIEYITDDIFILKPHSVIVHRHLIRFLMDEGGKIYYLEDFSDEQLNLIHAGLLKFTWELDVKINLFKNSDLDKEVLGL